MKYIDAEKLEALKRYVILKDGSAYSGRSRILRKGKSEWIPAEDVRALLAAHAKEGEGPGYRELVENAVSVLQRHIVPDGLSDKNALSELYGIFDGPKYRAVIASRPAPAAPDALLEALEAASNMLDKAVDFIDDDVMRGEVRCAEIAASRAALAPRKEDEG